MAFSVILTEKGGETQRLDFEGEEITIGRVDENDICLPKGNISKKHTKIVVKDGKIIYASITECKTQYSCSWIAALPPQVVARQSAEVDYVSGATQSTNAFYYAVIEALKQAK